ncbi:LOW QUALITY PROTEIN: hypothetical protein ACG7TL_003180 [Trametes sanguinea]
MVPCDGFRRPASQLKPMTLNSPTYTPRPISMNAQTETLLAEGPLAHQRDFGLGPGRVALNRYVRKRLAINVHIHVGHSSLPKSSKPGASQIFCARVTNRLQVLEVLVHSPITVGHSPFLPQDDNMAFGAQLLLLVPQEDAAVLVDVVEEAVVEEGAALLLEAAVALPVAAVVVAASVEVAVEVLRSVAVPRDAAAADAVLLAVAADVVEDAVGGSNVIVKPHRHKGVFIAEGKESLLVTKNLVPGEAVYGEKRISVDGGVEGTKVEYRVWNPFRSKLAAGILGGLDAIFIEPGKKVLYLGAASGTSVSHVADIVGPEGVVYAVEFSLRSGRDLIGMAKKRTNVIPIVEDARTPHRYRMLLSTVDVIFADVAQPDQARIVTHNAEYFLKDGGHVVVSIKASCIDSTAPPEAVFAKEVDVLREHKFKPIEQVTLEPYERDHAMPSTSDTNKQLRMLPGHLSRVML